MYLIQRAPSNQVTSPRTTVRMYVGSRLAIACVLYRLHSYQFLRSVFQPEIDSGNPCFRFRASGSMDPKSIALLVWRSDTLAMIRVWTQTLLVSQSVALTGG
jgi:hypothetical protein